MIYKISPCLRRGFLPAPRLRQTGSRQANPSLPSGPGSAPEGLMPRREALWAGGQRGEEKSQK